MTKLACKIEAAPTTRKRKPKASKLPEVSTVICHRCQRWRRKISSWTTGKCEMSGEWRHYLYRCDQDV